MIEIKVFWSYLFFKKGKKKSFFSAALVAKQSAFFETEIVMCSERGSVLFSGSVRVFFDLFIWLL